MEAAVANIKPNIKKAFILNIMIVSFILVLIISLLIYLHSIVGLGVFLTTFREIGIDISPPVLLVYSIFLIIFFTALFLILNYLTLAKISYTLYPDKIVYSRSLLIIRISDKVIPYSNIAKITYDKKPFLKTSKIVLELTGMKESKVEIDFIDNVEEVVNKIQELIREHRAKYYARYTEENRFQNIVDKY